MKENASVHSGSANRKTLFRIAWIASHCNLKKLNVHRKVLFIPVLALFLISSFHTQSFGQGVIPTKGKDFWLGFMWNPSFNSKRLDIFITSDISTTGVVSVPLQGWSQAFTVTAFQTTTVTIPNTIAEDSTSEILTNQGVHVLTQDTVSVFAINFQDYSADGTKILPKQSIGTEYRICSYPGISGYNFNSEFIVVATEDGTQVEITPTAPTVLGHPANVPFIISLDAGQVYEVQALLYSDDFTGTTIQGTDSSGSCRPFAVFSGAACTRVPSTCFACDHIYDECMPLPTWGTTYYSVPFALATTYTLRILADQNNTIYTINGGGAVTLNAGQFTEINGVTAAKCVQANRPFAVIQYMEGITCAGVGDPSMMYLNADDQKIDRVTFSTVTSSVITQHNVNVIMNTAHLSQLTLDGTPVPVSSFVPFPSTPGMSYAQLSLSQGSHSLSSDSGFTAYVYGTGSAESYAYSVGSYSKSKPYHVDSVYCTSDTVHLGVTTVIFGAWWSTATNPTDTIYVGNVLTLVPPVAPDVYVEHAFEYISGCDVNHYFNVEVPDPPVVVASLNFDTICPNQTVQLNAAILPGSSIYQYSWTPVNHLSNPNIANPVATPDSSTWYVVAVSSPGACAPTVYDSVYVYMTSGQLPVVSLGHDTTICAGQVIALNAGNPGSTYLWSTGDINQVIQVTTTNIYSVQVVDSNGCGGTDSIHVTSIAAPQITVTNDTTICAGDSIQLSANAAGGITYLWSPPTFLSTPNSQLTWTTPVLPINYQVTVWNSTGCSATESVYVNLDNIPAVNLGGDTAICGVATITFHATQGPSYTYAWQDNSTGDSFTADTLGIYWVDVTNHCGTSRDSVEIFQIHQLPVINLGAGGLVCKDSCVLDAGNPGATYLWSTGDTTQVIVPQFSGVYSVIVTTFGSCVNTSSVSLDIVQPPATNFGPDTMLCFGDVLVLNASSDRATYLWHDGSNLPEFVVREPGLYWADVTNYCGEIRDSILFDFSDCECSMYVPNSFTPDNDGTNDVFLPRAYCDIETYNLKVFNRWGELVFETNSIFQGWDGTYHGKLLPDAVYIFMLHYSGNLNKHEKSESLIGRLSLLR